MRSEVTHGVDGYFFSSPFSPIAGNASGTFPETTLADSSHSYQAKSVNASTVGSVPDIVSASPLSRSMTDATAFVQFGVDLDHSSDLNFQA